ncbi:MAG: hypothetical protein FWG07_09410 [Treponema sp.]|nr:hypothetical protein [Treponema sp.]
MNDIVIDTNVLLHSNNRNDVHYHSANETLKLVLHNDLFLCVDDIFDIDKTKNTSIIGHEYNTHVIPGTSAICFILDRVTKRKIRPIITKNYKNVKLKLSKMIKKGEVKNRHDVTFVIVAYGSQDKMLVSNDYDDFNKENRKYISNKFQVSILDSDEYAAS